VDWKDWEEAWKPTPESAQEAADHEKSLVLALVDVLLKQVRQAPVNRQQALAALDITKTVLQL
jgi:hypothetical protein